MAADLGKGGGGGGGRGGGIINWNRLRCFIHGFLSMCLVGAEGFNYVDFFGVEWFCYTLALLTMCCSLYFILFRDSIVRTK